MIIVIGSVCVIAGIALCIATIILAKRARVLSGDEIESDDVDTYEGEIVAQDDQSTQEDTTASPEDEE